VIDPDVGTRPKGRKSSAGTLGEGELGVEEDVGPFGEDLVGSGARRALYKDECCRQ